MNRFIGATSALLIAFVSISAKAEQSSFTMRCVVSANYDGGIRWEAYKKGAIFWLKGEIDSDADDADNILQIYAPHEQRWRDPFHKVMLLSESVVGVAEYEFTFEIDRSTGKLEIKDIEESESGRQLRLWAVDAMCETSVDAPPTNPPKMI